ncbi:MAG TPA: hypothetical protein VJ792_09075 [Candidatus Nitrosotalea sp.]|nr:hypothetical protein [Candidatus Nitrosotalea sp.]
MRKSLSIFVALFALGGMALVHPAFAHNFVQNSDADLIAKIQEFKVEAKLAADNAANSTLSQWHVSKSQGYFGGNEIGVLSQKDSNLANQISSSIDDLYSYLGQPNADPATADQKVIAIGNLLDSAESEQVSSSSQTNATVQALATVNVLNEVLKDYGDAIGSKVDLTNMNNMNMGTGSMSGMSSSGSSMSGMSAMAATPIVDMAAYQSAQALTSTAQTMFSNVQSMAPSNTAPYLTKVGSALTDLKQKIDSKSSGNDVMMVVHMNIHPNLISAFNIAAVPEFPVPALLVAVSFVGFLTISRFLKIKVI